MNAPPLYGLTKLKRHYHNQLFYYWHCLELEHLGDLGGPIRRIKDYPATTMTAWFRGIEALDDHPDLLPFMLSYYFPTGHHPALTRSCLSALEHHCFKHPDRKWRFIINGALIASHTLGDHHLALHLANRLVTETNPDTRPFFIKVFPATLLEPLSVVQAIDIYTQILANNQTLSPQEFAFIQARIKSLMQQYYCN